VTAMLFFDERCSRSPAQRFAWAFALALVLALTAAWLRPEFKISKIHATPSWVLYSAAASVLIFSALYWWIDVRGRTLWPALLEPVAANPLVAYLLPFIIGGLMGMAGLDFPLFLRQGGVGIVFFVFYALCVGFLVKYLALRGVRLRI
jgi:heparan-alpha-glucosaminide N-acetyltransferase